MVIMSKFKGFKPWTPEYCEKIFNKPCCDSTHKQCAYNSDVKFIRSKYQLAFYQGRGTGKILTAKETFDLIGIEGIDDAAWYGSTGIPEE